MTMSHPTTADAPTLGRFLNALGGAPWRLHAGKVTALRHPNQLDDVPVMCLQHADVRFTVPDGLFAWVVLATEDRDARLAALERLMRPSAHQPTWIIAQGDRYVALWQLREATDPKKIARVNAKLSAAFGGEDVDDATAPLPGSNGATVALHQPEAVYDVDHLAKARPPAIKLNAGEQAALDDEQGALLAELNERHAVLKQEGGKTRVMSWAPSEIDPTHETPILQSFDDFRNRYCNRKVLVPTERGMRAERLGKWWLDHPSRREYLELCFDPEQPKIIETPHGKLFNLWRGFATEPREGDWALMRRHIRDVLAGGDEASADYILRWCAWAVQNPGKPAEAALVLRGGRGTGKGVFARAVKSLFGQHGLQITSPMQLVGRFNSHLRDCVMLFADEAVAASDKAAESVLKGLITEPQLAIEGKGVNVVMATNRLHVIMASNDEWVVPAGPDERRFAVFDVSSIQAQKHGYFQRLTDELKNGGLAAMLHDLRAMDLDGWHPRRNIPQTTALAQQQSRSLRGPDGHVRAMLESGTAHGCLRSEGETVFISTALCGKVMGLDARDLTALGRSLAKAGGRTDRILVGDGHAAQRGRQRGYWLPKLTEARRLWARSMGFNVPWPSDDGQWDQADDAADSDGRAF